MKRGCIALLAALTVSLPAFAQSVDTLEGVYRADLGDKDYPAPLFVKVTKDGLLLQVSPPSLDMAENEKEITLEMRANGTRIGAIKGSDGKFTAEISAKQINLFSPPTSTLVAHEFGLNNVPLRRDKVSGALKVGIWDPYVFKLVPTEEVAAAKAYKKQTGEALRGKRLILESSKRIDKDGKDYDSWTDSLLDTGYSSEGSNKKTPDTFPKCAGLEFRADGKAGVLVQDSDTKELKELAQVAYLIDEYQKLLVVEHPYVKEESDGKKVREYSRFCVDVSAIQNGDLTLTATPLMTLRNNEPEQPIRSQYRLKVEAAK